jgi:ABC-2 type transport system ATP-binding protein
VLFLDEPTTAMDPHSARTVRDAIAELRAARRTVLLTTHNLTEAEELADRIVVIRGGLVVAEGTRDQLTRQLLGEPIWELQLAGPAHGVAQSLGDLVRIEASGADWVRYRCSDARAVNPQVIARLTQRGVAVVALAELPRRLEDVYLSIVEEKSVDRGSWSSAAETKSWELGAGGTPSNSQLLTPNPHLEEAQP